MNGKRSIRSIQGLQRDSEILYVATYEANNNNTNNLQKRGKLRDVFHHTDSSEDNESRNSSPAQVLLQRSKSNPNFLVNNLSRGHNDGDENYSPTDFVNQRNINQCSALMQASQLMTVNLKNSDNSDRSSSTESNSTYYKNLSQFNTKLREFKELSETDSEDDESNILESGRSLERFLIAWSLEDYKEM